MKQWKKHPLVTSFLIGTSVFFIICGMWWLGWFQSAELWVYDNAVKWRAGNGISDPRIVIVSLEESDIKKYDYPLRDRLLSQLLETIERDQPRAIGLDLYRDVPEPRNSSEVAELNRVLDQYPNIICIFKFGTLKEPFEINPPDNLNKSVERIGFNDFADDKTIRRGLIYMPNTFAYSSLAWQLALLYLAPMGIGPAAGDEGAVTLGKTTFKRLKKNDGGYTDVGGYQFLLDYKGPRGSKGFAKKTVDEVLTALPQGTFRDKVVLVGQAGFSTNDAWDTPFHDHLEPDAKIQADAAEEHVRHEREAGVRIHAEIVNQLLRAALDGEAPTIPLGIPAEAAWIFGWCLLAIALGYFCHSSWTFGAALLGTLAGLFVMAGFAFWHGVWLWTVMPGATILLTAGAVKAYMAQAEAKQRAVLMGLFSQHVSKDVAKIIWEGREDFMDGNRPKAQKLMVTVLFTDLKDYSTLSEKLEPDVLIEWVSECLGGLGHHVTQNGGMINKFMGDAIMAVFGAPIPSITEEAIRQDAINAVRCALDMRKEIGLLNEKWKARGLPEAGMRVGIYTGIVMGGLVGNADRLEYTTIGDTTNTAARLESVDKENTIEADGLCRILVGEPTFNLIQGSFSTNLMAHLKLKGQNKTTTVYRVLGEI